MAKAEPRVVREFAKGVRTSNAELCARCIEELEEKSPGLFKAAMQAIAKSPCGSDEFRLRLLGVWVSCGDAIRHATNDDLALVGGLRAMLPRYTGPAITLYRAENAYNRKRRTYGLSWTSSAEVGREFAKTGRYRTYDGGSVLLETDAPAPAIVCAPGLFDDRYAENEYIVDRSRLGPVKVLERYGQLTHDEFRRQR